MESNQTDEPVVLSDREGAVFGRVDGMHKVRYIEMFLAGRKAETGDLVAACYNPMFAEGGIPASKDTAPQALVEGIDFDVLAVPGHSPAHLAYHADGCLLSGDVLFAGSVGRTDFPGSDWDTLVASIRMLLDTLPAETVVYPGHGPTTTLGAELERNPFLAELRAERAG